MSAFQDALTQRGFEPVTGRTPSGVRVFEAHPNRFLTYSVRAFEDGTALFSWEFAVGEYLATKGIQFGSDETLNQFAYPRLDVRGPQDPAWVASAIEQAESLLAEIRFDRAE